MEKGSYVESNSYGYGTVKEVLPNDMLSVRWERGNTVFTVPVSHVTKANVVKCKYCGVFTPMLGTQQCDPCHELATRLRMQLQENHEVVRKILAEEAPKFTLLWNCTLSESIAFEARIQEKKRL